ADVYLTEFNRLFNHFYFRHIAQERARLGSHDPRAAAILDPTDSWVDKHFRPGGFYFRRRELFRARF
ncbi:MAG: hypothetical protein WBB64_07920, partial [Anaerolineales bacterium]